MPENRLPSRSRRRFLAQATACAAVSALPGVSLGEAVGAITPNAFQPLPLGQVRPTGWLLDQLRIQASGLGGHLDETWKDVGPNSGWLGGTGESWERGPYFLDGLIPLAWLLNDSALKAKAQKFIDWTLASQQPNGMFGPASNDDWWPRMVMLKALTQYHEATSDARVIPLMQRYFVYQAQTLPARPLRDWGKFRWQDNALSVLWLHQRSADPALLALVQLLHAQGYDWQAQYATFPYPDPITRDKVKQTGGGMSEFALGSHGVNNGQALKAAPVWSTVTGKQADRDGIHTMLATLDKYHGLPNGIFSCDEHFSGTNPTQGSELCTVVETMFSLEQSLAILGDAALGDRLELLAFNTLPGAFTDDMWAHQYNQEPNQVECSLHRKPWSTDGPESNLFGLEPNYGCCTANFHQGWPKFATSLWMSTAEGGLVAAAYSPCEARTMAGGVDVHLAVQTEYPFRESVRITVNPAAAASFAVSLRIPAWAAGASIAVNGKAQSAPTPGTFALIRRRWNAGDVIELHLPMQPRVIAGFQGSVSIQRGPLVFAFPIGESWVKMRERGLTADWQVYPSTAWNYALAISPGDTRGLTVKEMPLGKMPFSRKEAPVTIDVEARLLDAWRATDGAADVLPESPVKTASSATTITLVPYAAAKLRITAFPRLAV